jgi:hypothetical protein
MLCAVGGGGLDLLRSLKVSHRTYKISDSQLPIAPLTFVLSRQFSKELPTPVQAAALTLNCSHSQRDIYIQLKV